VIAPKLSGGSRRRSNTVRRAKVLAFIVGREAVRIAIDLSRHATRGNFHSAATSASAARSNSCVLQFILRGPGDVPIPGYYDADRIMDPAIYHKSTVFWFVLLSMGGTERIDGLGQPTDVPFRSGRPWRSGSSRSPRRRSRTPGGRAWCAEPVAGATCVTTCPSDG
jgi:hypothetical protein